MRVPKRKTSVVLFSGGLDSTTGVLDRLVNTNEELLLVSHISKQTGTIKTQKGLIDSFNSKFNNRCKHIKFECGLKGKRSGIEETQRSRSFLYSSIAFAVACTYSVKSIFFYENGITSLNFPKRQDLSSSRASRTTHPKTLGLMQEFLNLIYKNIKIEHPYLFKTKSDILSILSQIRQEKYIGSTVSCNRTFQRISQATHCGVCSQCIDRRIAVYSSRLDDFVDDGLYNFSFLSDIFENNIGKNNLVDYIRQAKEYSEMNLNSFGYEMVDQLVDVLDFIEGNFETEKAEKIHNLCIRHSKQVENALRRMREKYDSPYRKIRSNSFFEVISSRDYLREPVMLLADSICLGLNKAIPIAFRKNKPKDENDFNDKVEAILSDKRSDYEREFPLISFAHATAKPDHSFLTSGLFIESKYIRGKTTPSKVTEGIAADLSKYPKNTFKLFVVYDPERNIHNDEIFKNQFENNHNCRINIIR